MTHPNPGAPPADDFPEANLPASDELGPLTPQSNLGDTVEADPAEDSIPYNPAGTRADGGGAPSGGEPPVSPEAPGGVAGGGALGALGALGGMAGSPGNPQGVD